MGLFDKGGAKVALDRLLDQERSLILSGKIEALARVAAEKDRLLELLATTNCAATELTALRRKVDRNQELLSAVARGIRTASRRLEAMRAQQNGRARFSTYDQGGRSAQLIPRKSQFERRA